MINHEPSSSWHVWPCSAQHPDELLRYFSSQISSMIRTDHLVHRIVNHHDEAPSNYKKRLYTIFANHYEPLLTITIDHSQWSLPARNVRMAHETICLFVENAFQDVEWLPCESSRCKMVLGFAWASFPFSSGLFRVTVARNQHRKAWCWVWLV